MAPPTAIPQPLSQAHRPPPAPIVPYQFDQHGRPIGLIFRNNILAAFNHRRRVKAPPRLAAMSDPTIVQVEARMNEYVADMMQAFYNMSSAVDNPNSDGMEFCNLSNPNAFSPRDVEATLFTLFYVVMQQVKVGFRGQSDRLGSTQRKQKHRSIKKEDCDSDCRTRMSNIVQTIRDWKCVCCDIMESDEKIANLANVPVSIWHDKLNNIHNNNRKAQALDGLKEASGQHKGSRRKINTGTPAVANRQVPDRARMPPSHIQCGFTDTPKTAHISPYAPLPPDQIAHPRQGQNSTVPPPPGTQGDGNQINTAMNTHTYKFENNQFYLGAHGGFLDSNMLASLTPSLDSKSPNMANSKGSTSSIHHAGEMSNNVFSGFINSGGPVVHDPITPLPLAQPPRALYGNHAKIGSKHSRTPSADTQPLRPSRRVKRDENGGYNWDEDASSDTTAQHPEDLGGADVDAEGEDDDPAYGVAFTSQQ